MRLTRLGIDIAVAASTFVGYTSAPVNGLIHSIEFTTSTGTALSSTAKLVFTGEGTGTAILSKLATAARWRVAPRIDEADVVDTTGAAIGTTKNNPHAVGIPIVDERIKLVVSNATDTGQTAHANVYIEGA